MNSVMCRTNSPQSQGTPSVQFQSTFSGTSCVNQSFKWGDMGGEESPLSPEVLSMRSAVSATHQAVSLVVLPQVWPQS